MDKGVRNLHCEIGKLWQLLHESHKQESMVEREDETARNEVNSLRKGLEILQGQKVKHPQVTQLQEEAKQLELQLLEQAGICPS